MLTGSCQMGLTECNRGLYTYGAGVNLVHLIEEQWAALWGGARAPPLLGLAEPGVENAGDLASGGPMAVGERMPWTGLGRPGRRSSDLVGTHYTRLRVKGCRMQRGSGSYQTGVG